MLLEYFLALFLLQRKLEEEETESLPEIDPGIKITFGDETTIPARETAILAHLKSTMAFATTTIAEKLRVIRQAIEYAFLITGLATDHCRPSNLALTNGSAKGRASLALE